MAEEELAELVVGNDSGMCNAGFLGDDAARAVLSDARHDGRTEKSGITQSTTNSGLRLKNILAHGRSSEPQASRRSCLRRMTVLRWWSHLSG